MKRSFRILLIVAVVLNVGLFAALVSIPKCESPVAHFGLFSFVRTDGVYDYYNLYVDDSFSGIRSVKAGSEIHGGLFYSFPEQSFCLKTY
jgi:hypothetical protein